MKKDPFHRFKTRLECANVGSIFDPKSTGYIYVIGPLSRPYVKIGKSVFPGLRLNELQAGSWEELAVRGIVAVSDGSEISVEFVAHAIAKKRGHHVHREWFQCSVNEALDCILEAAEKVEADYYPVSSVADAVDAAHWDGIAENEETRLKELRNKLGIDESELSG